MRHRSTTTTITTTTTTNITKATDADSSTLATSVEVLEDCYLRVIADPELSACFDWVDILAIKHHLRSVIADAVGRPEPPHPSRHGIRLSAEQRARVRGHLVDVLAGVGVNLPIPDPRVRP